MTTLQEAVDKINGLEAGQDEITGIVAGIQAAQATTDLKLDDIRAKIALLESQGGNPEAIDALNGKIDTLITKQTAVKTAMLELATQANAIRDEANSVE